MLSKAPAEWLYATAPDGVKLKRETNSMPQWAGSCWYYLRFCDNKNSDCFIDPVKEKYWLPVDLYVGGAEHAVLHLLYSRFWHKVLFDRGHVTTPEPFGRLVNQGMILGEMEFTAYRTVEHNTEAEGSHPLGAFISARDINEITHATSDGTQVEPGKLSPDAVEKKGDAWILKSDPTIAVDARSFKMSKSRGNVINPDHVVQEYGADSLRMYEMFMGPLEATKPWSMAGVDGVFRFLGRVWRLMVDERADDVQLSEAVQDVPATPAQLRTLHKTIKAVTDDLDKLSFNTAISRMMEFTNEFTSMEVRPKSVLEPFVLLLSPFAPHAAEELWELMGHTKSLAYEPWPTYDPALLVESEIEVPVQVNGKVRGKVMVPADADQAVVVAAAQEHATISQNLAGKSIVKIIYVPGKLLNI
ncbi:MAG: leucine--tRNA ligase, partial [Planctomycetales bacterium 12-60-4]